MRGLGMILLATSLALSVGGVAYHPHVPSGTASSGTEPPGETRAGVQEICPVERDRASVRSTRIEFPRVTRPVVSLGTSGFNYSRPGDPVPNEARPASGTPAAPAE